MLITAGKVLGMVLTFALALLMTVDDYGGFTYARNLVFLFGPLVLLGLNIQALPTITRFTAAGDNAAASEFMTAAYTGVIVSGFVVLLLLLLFAAYAPLDDALRWVVALAAPSVWVYAVIAILGQFCIAFSAPNAAFIPRYFAVSAATTAFVLLFALFDPNVGAEAAVIALFLGYFSALLVQVIALNRVKPPELRFDAKKLKFRFNVLTDSAPLIITVASTLMIARFPMFVLPFFVDVAQVGIFGFALALIMLNRVVIEAAIAAYLAKLTSEIAQEKVAAAAATLRQLRVVVFGMTVAISAVVVLAGPEIFHLVFDQDTLERSLLLAFSLNMLILGVAGPLDRACIAFKIVKPLVRIDAAAAVVTVLASILLIGPFGLHGAVFAGIAGLAVQQAGRVYLVHWVRKLAF